MTEIAEEATNEEESKDEVQPPSLRLIRINSSDHSRVSLHESEVQDHNTSATDQMIGLEAQSLLRDVIQVADWNEQSEILVIDNDQLNISAICSLLQ